MDGQAGIVLWFPVFALCMVHIHGGLIVESHLERYCQATAIGLVAIFSAVVMELVCVRLSWSFTEVIDLAVNFAERIWSALSRLSRRWSFKPSRKLPLHTGRQHLLVLPFRNVSSFKPSRRLHPGRELLLALPFRNMSNPLSRFQLPARKLSTLRCLYRERKCHGISSCCFVYLLLLYCWCWCDCCALVAVMLLVCCCWSCVELYRRLCTAEVWCCFLVLVSQVDHLRAPSMVASGTARLGVVFRYQLHAIVAATARCYCSRHVDCYISQPSLEILEMIGLCD
jgi:hypothetical protein